MIDEAEQEADLIGLLQEEPDLEDLKARIEELRESVHYWHRQSQTSSDLYYKAARKAGSMSAILQAIKVEHGEHPPEACRLCELIQAYENPNA